MGRPKSDDPRQRVVVYLRRSTIDRLTAGQPGGATVGQRVAAVVEGEPAAPMAIAGIPGGTGDRPVTAARTAACEHRREWRKVFGHGAYCDMAAGGCGGRLP